MISQIPNLMISFVQMFSHYQSQDTLPKLVNLRYFCLNSACMMGGGGGGGGGGGYWYPTHLTLNVDYYHIKFENETVSWTLIFTQTCMIFMLVQNWGIRARCHVKFPPSLYCGRRKLVFILIVRFVFQVFLCVCVFLSLKMGPLRQYG